MAHVPAEPAQKPPAGEFKPYVSPEESPPEFTIKAVIFGALFGVIFGASTVYLALRAGLTVSASIPIAVLSISVLRFFGRATILENNIVQTIGSAGESVAAGVAFTIPAFLFLSQESKGPGYFNYWTITMLAACGGILGVLFMVPLRRALIVGEHGKLPYPEGTACADVLIAGEKGGKMARLVFGGVGLAILYKAANSIFSLWKEAPTYQTASKAALPNATVSAEISPEYLGVGYILGPRIGGIMASGSVLAWIVLIPLLTVFVPQTRVMEDLAALGFSPAKIAKMDEPERFYRAYIRLIGAGAVTMAGIITLLRTLPTIISAVKGSFASMGAGGAAGAARTERDIPISVVALGSLALAGILVVLPILPGDFTGKAIMAVLMLAFGFLFVTVSSRIVGLIGSSSNPISGMTIATLLGTSLVFVAMGLGGELNQPVALSVGAIVCIAAANAGATSQDLKTGFLVGATPIRQQVGLVIGVIASTLVIGLTIQLIDSAYAPGPGEHGIGTPKFAAPQANLMATLIKGVMSGNLEWAYITIGAGLALAVYMCGVSPLAWAVGAYLPIATTFPIFLGGLLRGLIDRLRGEKGDSEISSGTLFATGLVAGGALTGVGSAALKAIELKRPEGDTDVLTKLQHIGESFQTSLGLNADVVALVPYAIMVVILASVGMRKMAAIDPRAP